MASEGAEQAGQEREQGLGWAVRERARQLECVGWVLLPLCLALFLVWKWVVLAGSLAPVPEDDTANAAWRVTMTWIRWSYLGLYLVCALPSYVLLAYGPERGAGSGFWRMLLVAASLLVGLGIGALWAWGLPGATGGLYLVLWALALLPGVLALRVLFDRSAGAGDSVEQPGVSSVSGQSGV